MSFQGLTPEALVERSDSKNPATTCKGLTASGKPCRRGIASTPGTSPGNSPLKTGNSHGVIAILNEGDAAAFFCWQHKDQAQNLVAEIHRRSQAQQTRIVSLQKRSSIDTLAEKVGILGLDADQTQKQSKRERRRTDGRNEVRIRKRDTLPTEWQGIEGPLMSVPEEVMEEALPSQSRPPRRSTYQREKYAKSNVKASWSCCIRADDGYNDDGPPVRRRERHEQRRPSSQSRPMTSTTVPVQPQNYPNSRRQSQDRHRRDSISHPSQLPHTPPRGPPSLSTATRPTNSPAHAQTQNFLSYIPPHLDPTTTSSLLAELSKPFAKDDEAGYIYIFWLTPESEQATPDDDVASTILDGDLDYQDQQQSTRSRRPSINTSPNRRRHRTNQLNRFASVKQSNSADADTPPLILLKIGRAQNVHRRLAQWTKQCNQNITLVRYYPHYASKEADPDGLGGLKVPHVNRVERLIHIELRGMGWGKKGVEKCEACGREHREWFEVPASRKGLRGVDEVVRRWVGWAEGSD